MRARTGRQFFIVLKKMIPEMSHSLVPLLFFVVMVVVIWCFCFDSHVDDFGSPLYTSYNWFFLIFTNDTFARILPAHLSANSTYLMFFFPCIYVGQRFLLSIIIGDTYETYKSLVKKQLKKEKMKEMQGLVKAFSALDHDKSGSISKYVWKEVLKKYDPSIPDEAIALYFELIAQGGDVVNVLQFLSLRRVLNFNLTLNSPKSKIFGVNYFETKYKELTTYVFNIYKKIQLHVPELRSRTAQQILKLTEGKGTVHLFTKVCALDIYVFCCDMSDYTLLSLNNGRILFNIGDVFHLFYILEFVIRLNAFEGRIIDTHKKNNFTSMAFVCGVISMLILRILNIYGFYSKSDIMYKSPFELNVPPYLSQYLNITSMSYNKLFLISYAFRCVRIRNLNKTLLSFSMAIIDVLPALIETFCFTLIISYITGVFGHVLFGFYMDEWKTPLAGVVKAQQLSYMVDFLDSTEKAMVKVHPVACIFFICYLLLSLTVSNIALSIIIEVQNNMLQGKTSLDRDSQKAKVELVFEQIKQQARKRAIVGCEKYNMNFSNIQMSQFQNSDTRHFIADMDGEKGLKLEELKQCQKYSTINLSEHYQVHNRLHKDLNWEVDFVHSLEDENVGIKKVFQFDDLMFSAEEAANFLYLVIKGSIYLQEYGSNRLANISATNAVGSECLNTKGKFSYTCTAGDNDTTCIVISREDLENKISTNMCGSVLRLCFKTNMLILNQFTQKQILLKRKSCTNVLEAPVVPKSNSSDGNNSRSTTPASHTNIITKHVQQTQSLAATNSTFKSLSTEILPIEKPIENNISAQSVDAIITSDIYEKSTLHSLHQLTSINENKDNNMINDNIGTAEDDTTSELTSAMSTTAVVMKKSIHVNNTKQISTTSSLGLTSISSDEDDEKK